MFCISSNLTLIHSEDSQQVISCLTFKLIPFRMYEILKFKSNLCSSNQILLKNFRNFQNEDLFQKADQLVYLFVLKQQCSCSGFFAD